MANFNLKTIFAADTKDLKQGAAEAKQAVKDFDDATTSALDQIAGLFGTTMGDISKTLSSVRGGFLQFNSALAGASQASGLLSKAMSVLKIAIASTGIGLLVVALGSLVAYFTKSQAGSDKLAVAMGQLKQVFLVISDAAIAIGRTIVNAVEKTFGFFESRFKLLKKRMGIKEVAAAEEDADKNVFQRRKELTLRQQKLEKDQIQWTVDKAKLQAEIEKQKEIAADKVNKTTAERLAANLKAQELLNELYAREEAYAQEKLDILKVENSLSESMNADLQAEADLEAKIIELTGQRASRNKELLSQQAELTALAKKEREDREKAEALALKKQQYRVEAIDPAILGRVQLPGVTTAIKPTIDMQPVADATEEAKGYFIDFQKIATDFSNTVSDAFASMIEGLVSGNLSIQDVFGTILSFLAETLKSIGKALIAYGTAMEAFKAAFKDPWLAIAAGAALVAAGSVLTGLIGKMSSGGSTSMSSNYATATLSGGSSLDLTNKTQLQSQNQEIKVTGKIVASPRELAILISNENQRKLLTT